MTELEIILTITLGVMITGIALYFYFRTQYEYYEAEIMSESENVGGMLIFYDSESSGNTLRKSKRTDRWQVARKNWYKMFGVYRTKLKWEPLFEPHISSVKEKLERGEKITLRFD